MWFGCRPLAAACARTSFTYSIVSDGFPPPTKTASAWAAANALPAGEAPAWKMTGVLCGDG